MTFQQTCRRLGKTAAQHYAERRAERAASIRRTIRLFNRLVKIMRPPS